MKGTSLIIAITLFESLIIGYVADYLHSNSLIQDTTWLLLLTPFIPCLNVILVDKILKD